MRFPGHRSPGGAGMAGAVVLAREACVVSGRTEGLRCREPGDAGPGEQDRASFFTGRRELSSRSLFRKVSSCTKCVISGASRATSPSKPACRAMITSSSL
jgi:hypothetical protein